MFDPSGSACGDIGAISINTPTKADPRIRTLGPLRGCCSNSRTIADRRFVLSAGTPAKFPLGKPRHPSSRPPGNPAPIRGAGSSSRTWNTRSQPWTQTHRDEGARECRIRERLSAGGRRIRTCMGLFLSRNCLWFLPVLGSERGRTFFAPSPAISGSRSARKGSGGRNGNTAWRLAA
jgi:hypothetical protein